LSRETRTTSLLVVRQNQYLNGFGKSNRSQRRTHGMCDYSNSSDEQKLIILISSLADTRIQSDVDVLINNSFFFSLAMCAENRQSLVYRLERNENRHIDAMKVKQGLRFLVELTHKSV
jgi:hypothetical protein